MQKHGHFCDYIQRKVVVFRHVSVNCDSFWLNTPAGWVAQPIISELYKNASSVLNLDASGKLKELELFDDLKSAFYEAEDILDDVEYYRLEKQIQDDCPKSEVAAPRRDKDRVKKPLRQKVG